MRIFQKSPTLTATVSLVALVAFSSCKSDSGDDLTLDEFEETIPISTQNNLTDTQSSLLQRQSTSAINWQPWSKEIFEEASQEKKTVFAFIGSGTDSHNIAALNRLNQSPQACATLNEHHINILVDSDIHPDLEFFAASLCLKSGTPVSTPLLVWFSLEGIPISWIPISHGQKYNIAEFISRTSNTVSHMWQDSPEYVLKNSREDFTRRMNSYLPEPTLDEDKLLPLRATRQAASLFDPTTATIDGMGKMSIARYIKLLTTASRHPDLSEAQSQRYLKIAGLTADSMLLRGLIDPLDGGVYSGIERSTTALPIFSKKLRTQAYSMDALYSLYQVTQTPRYLKAADSILQYTLNQLAQPDGSYSLGIIYDSPNLQDNPCTWTLEELEAALTPEEMKLCALAFGIKGLGNIPLEDDPDRAYFRQNTLTWKLDQKELAQQSGLSSTTLDQTLSSITKKLAKLRTEKKPAPLHEKLSTADSMALLASSYVKAYQATKDPKHLERAAQTLSFIRNTLQDSSETLYQASFNGKRLDHTARGIAFANVCQAALDLHEATQDSNWLKYASKTHQNMSKHLGSTLNYHITESDGTDYPYPLTPYQHLTFPALDNGNTWAIAYSNAKRLSKLQPSDELQKQSNSLEAVLLSALKTSPLASIDFLTANARIQSTNGSSQKSSE